MVKSKTNQALEQPTYIVLQVSWRSHLIFPLEMGFDFLKLRAQAIHVQGDLKHDRDEPLKMNTDTEAQTIIQFMTETQVKELKVSMLLDPPEEES
jgi:hypothetical protein